MYSFFVSLLSNEIMKVLIYLYYVSDEKWAYLRKKLQIFLSKYSAQLLCAISQQDSVLYIFNNCQKSECLTSSGPRKAFFPASYSYFNSCFFFLASLYSLCHGQTLWLLARLCCWTVQQSSISRLVNQFLCDVCMPNMCIVYIYIQNKHIHLF